MEVKILSGGYGMRHTGGGTKLVLKGSIVQLADEEAKRLILIGAAEEIRTEIQAESVERVCDTKTEWNADMTNEQLRQIAKERGIKLPPRATKAQIIEALGK